MAKSDFNVEEENYYNEEATKKAKDKNEEKATTQDVYKQDYDENSDFSNIGINQDLDYIDNSSVVFEDKADQTPEEKIKYYLSTINTRAVIVVVGILFLILVILLLIFAYISKEKASYYSEVITPEVVYMGETGNISVISKGKKNLDKVEVSYKTNDDNIVTILEEKQTGKDVLNTIIPIQEGRTTIEVNSTLNNKKMAKEKREIVVCPAFNTDLLLTENISVIQDTTHDLTTEFGEEECAKNIKYESSNEEIATIDENGQIKGISVGKTIITIKKEARTISVNVEVTEDYIQTETFKVTPKKVQLSPNQNIRIKVGYTPANATTSKINFDTSNQSIATVSDGGLITAVSPGTATITVQKHGIKEEIQVIVSEEKSEDGEVVTEMTLDKTDITMIQGDSEKVQVTLSPDNAKNKKVTWESSDTSIATVTDQGVIFAKTPGVVDVTATANNDISKVVKVTITKMKNPVITANDNIETNQWHNKPFILNFSGSENGVSYYYGKTENEMKNKGTKVTLSKDEKSTYYVKACKNNVCSETVQYIVKLDVTKPQVLTVAGIDSTATKEDTVQIAMKDITSQIKQWCVTPVDSESTCKWKTIQSSNNPVVSYTATYNSAYYAFAKDVAGNISNSYKFEITNIE